ncbi:MAG TPA: hypothetical protein VF008_15835 [Niastella sp.]
MRLLFEVSKRTGTSYTFSQSVLTAARHDAKGALLAVLFNRDQDTGSYIYTLDNKYLQKQYP